MASLHTFAHSNAHGLRLSPTASALRRHARKDKSSTVTVAVRMPKHVQQHVPPNLMPRLRPSKHHRQAEESTTCNGRRAGTPELHAARVVVRLGSCSDPKHPHRDFNPAWN